MTSANEHRDQADNAARRRAVRCAVLTVSDTRTLDTDVGGRIVVEQLNAARHEIAARTIVRDEPVLIEAQLQQWLADPEIHAIITTGGTGIARRDTTIEVVRRLLSIELEGFGELFRMLSYEQVKASAMLSRAAGGLVIRESAQGGETFIFAVPGSPNAVTLAMEKLIAPELAHLVWERKR